MSHIDLSAYQDAIAVIGLACHFPGAGNAEEFWQNLQAGKESVTFFTEEELRAAGVDPALLRDPHYVRASAILENIELFDAEFFGYTPREAEIIDPQQRLFLECAWEALEDAGYGDDREERRIGVYAGVGINTYLLSHLQTHPEIIENAGWLQMMVSNEKDHLTTRVSYKLNLSGPSLSISTACSTSLVAIHLACQGLLNGECHLSLAGGVAFKVPQKAGYLYQEGGTSSPDGHCRAFDAQAQGTLPGNGVGVVVLKRLADALEDGDCIRAIIRGSAINNDGATKIGYTAPSVQGQAKVIAEALALAQVEPESIGYIEAHGTGTALGDPVEVRALTEAFRLTTEKRQFCALGSVKTNFGHLDTAAGVAGFIKTVLSLEHHQLPPSLHFQQPNPDIDFAKSPFYVNTVLRDWETTEERRRAGVNSLGLGGTNAHVILEEAPPLPLPDPAWPYQLLLFSARTSSALDRVLTNLGTHLQRRPDLNLADIAYTLQVGRKSFAQRAFLVCRTVEEAGEALQPARRAEIQMEVSSPTNERAVVFLFPGQGMQHVDMARELYQQISSFREQVDNCARLLTPRLGIDIRQFLYPEEDRREEAASWLNRMDGAQPVLFTIEYALAKLWMEWGVEPFAMIGHSLGEYVAACLAGVFSLEDALDLVVLRSRLMQEQSPGAMLTIGLSRRELQPLLTADLSLAAHNSPTDCVVAGTLEAVEQLEARLNAQEIFCRRLPLPRAAHSFMLDPALERFRTEVRKKLLNAPKLPYLSNVTGTWITAEEARDPEYWVGHLRQTVRFAEDVAVLVEGGSKIWLELGPGRTLTTLVRHHPGVQTEQILLQSLRHPRDSQSDLAFLLNTCGLLWSSGQLLLWEKFHSERRRRVPLPTYPFERQVYWIAPAEQGRRQPAPRSLERRAQLSDWFSTVSWKRVPLANVPVSNAQERWLIFADEMGLGHRIARQLVQLNIPAIQVNAGEQFSRKREDLYILHPRRRDDYLKLMQALNKDAMLPTHILHAWTLVPERPESSSPEQRFEDAQARGFYSLLLLTQALGDLQVSAPLQLLLLSNNLHEVLGGEIVEPERATVLGANLVIPAEYPNIISRNLDIGAFETETEQERLAALIIVEGQAQTEEEVIAYRGAYRWIRELAPVVLEEASETPFCLRENGVYVIIGGTGGIGLALAEYLAREVRAKLVLAGRSPLPARAEWQNWLTSHGEHDAVASKIRQIQRIEDVGAEVRLIQADITDEGQVRSLLQQVRQECGALHGLIHAAGIAGEGLLQRKNLAEAAGVLAPKVQGLLVLERALQGMRLDFLVLCSSLASIFGGPGLVDYSASNAFLDIFAFYYSARSGTPTIAINWDTWREVGMASMASRLQFLSRLAPDVASELKGSIEASEGQALFRRILSRLPAPQIIVSPRELQALKQYHRARLSLPDSRISAPNTGSNVEARVPPHGRRRASLTPYCAPQNNIEQQLARIWQTILGVDPIGVHDNYFEIGGDSVMIIQIIRLIHEAFQITLPMHLLFEAPTIAALAQIVAQKQAELLESEQLAELLLQVSQMSEEEVMMQLKSRQ